VKGTSACPQASSVDKPAPAQNIVQKTRSVVRNHPRIPPTIDFFGRAENIFGGLLSCNMLALPRELNLDITGFTEVTDSTTHALINLVN
jgi:hypothetical protein